MVDSKHHLLDAIEDYNTKQDASLRMELKSNTRPMLKYWSFRRKKITYVLVHPQAQSFTYFPRAIQIDWVNYTDAESGLDTIKLDLYRYVSLFKSLGRWYA